MPTGSDERQGAERRAGIVLQADRVVLQKARGRRGHLLQAFDIWLAENFQLTVEALLSGAHSAEGVSEALVAYGKDFSNAGKSYGTFAETINRITAQRPGLRR